MSKNLSFVCTGIMVILVTACKKTNNNAEEPEEDTRCVQSISIPANYPHSAFTPITYNRNHCGYLPLGKQHYWVYTDSIFDSNGQFQSTLTDTTRFSKTYQTPDSIIWWSYQYRGAGIGLPAYLYSTDSTAYGALSAEGGKKGMKWFYSFPGDSLYEYCNFTDQTWECFAKKIPGTVTVPAGSFSGTMFYRKALIGGSSYAELLFKPGVGMLRGVTYFKPAGSPAIVQRTSVLRSFFIP